MTELELDADLDVWVGLPSHWDEATWPDHATWAREQRGSGLDGSPRSRAWAPTGSR